MGPIIGGIEICYGERVNEYECILVIHNVPGENFESIQLELFDILEDVEILPYDYNLHAKKVGERL